jgi:hypothetical protein
MFPQEFAFSLIQAKHALASGDCTSLKRVAGSGRRCWRHSIGQINATFGHDRSGIPGADGGPPQDWSTTGGEFFHEASFAPD